MIMDAQNAWKHFFIHPFDEKRETGNMITAEMIKGNWVVRKLVDMDVDVE